MSIEAGRRLAHYEIVEPIGKGGMGEVYRARDTKLGRDVAIKVLPDELAQDRSRLDRFGREARLLAQLNHASVATLYGLEEHDGRQFLVMELVEGETLAERIAQGPLPIDDAVPLFVQIAEGLEAAHEKGIIHRDLKPANIKISPDGKPKILDFGLAKAFADEAEPLADSSQSPTLTKGTALGVIMGTASYMSPEQARGKPLDRRTDIWAFGCCLYEALVRRKAFAGETVTDTLAKIVEREPDWKLLPERTPRATRLLLERCLRKKKEQRLRSAGDIALELGEHGVEPAVADAPPPRGRAPLVLAVTAAVALVGGYLLGDRPGEDAEDAEEMEPSHWAVSLPPGASFRDEGIALTPDGRTLVASVARDGLSQLYRKDIDSPALEPIPGTEGGFAPFFSPDGEWIGFFGNGRLRKIRLDGGRAFELCEYGFAAEQGAWGTDGTIVYRDRGLMRCDSDGVELARATERGQLGESSHGAPSFLPNGSILFGVGGATAVPSLAFMPADSDAWFPLPVESRAAVYVASGYLVYERDGRLLAAPFDPDKPTRVGRETVVIDNLYDDSYTTPAFAVSASGTLAFLPGTAARHQLVWVDRDGRVTANIGEPVPTQMYPRLSPDGNTALVSVSSRTGEPPDLWLYDTRSGRRTRLTFARSSWTAVWAPDGRRIAFQSGAGADEGRGVYLTSIDTTPESELLQLTAGDAHSWSPDGRTLLFARSDEITRRDVWMLDVDGAREARPLLSESYDEHTAVFSPNGEWIAYTSNESGRSEVYVAQYPEPGRKHSVSTSGGWEPVWSRDGRELFFRDDDLMLVVDVRYEPELEIGEPRELFRGGNFRVAPAVDSNYDISSDGERFLMIQPTGEAPREIHVIVNWVQQLERLVPTDDER